MFLVGVMVKAKDWQGDARMVVISQPIEVKKETPKQFSIGANEVNRAVVLKKDLNDVFSRTSVFGINFFAFCDDDRATEMLATCATKAVKELKDQYEAISSMVNAVKEKGYPV